MTDSPGAYEKILDDFMIKLHLEWLRAEKQKDKNMMEIYGHITRLLCDTIESHGEELRKKKND